MDCGLLAHLLLLFPCVAILPQISYTPRSCPFVRSLLYLSKPVLAPSVSIRHPVPLNQLSRAFITRGHFSPIKRRGPPPHSPLYPALRRAHQNYACDRLCRASHQLDSLRYARDTVHAPIRPYSFRLFGYIILGIVIVLFFQCMAALFDRVHRRREGIKWGLVSYTVLMFSFVTVFTVMNALNAWSADENVASAKGRVGYIVADLMFLLNYWLADGLSVGISVDPAFAPPGLTLVHSALSLLRDLRHEQLGHRFPLSHVSRLCGYDFELYTHLRRRCELTSLYLAMGIMFLISEGGGWGHFSATATLDFGLPYLLIAVSLNIVLTLLIVIRLAMHSRNVSSAMGVPGGIGGSYKTIIVVLVESSALYALSSLLVIGLWAVGTGNVFLPILAETQVRVSPQPRSSDILSNAMTGRTGHRSASHHPTSRQPERIGEQR